MPFHYPLKNTTIKKIFFNWLARGSPSDKKKTKTKRFRYAVTVIEIIS